MVGKKVLTVIIPTYNMEKYLHKCLESLVISERNMEYVEILVINDGSTDASSEIAHVFETKYPKSFRVIDKVNGNYGSCINRGVLESTGKYIKILDADDSFIAANFDLFIDFLLTTDSDLIINDYCSVNDKGEILESYNFQLPFEKVFTLDDMSDNTIGWLAMHGITHKRNNLLKINYKQTEGIPYTDEQWVIEPTAFAETISYFPHDLYLYLIGREGQTVDPKILKKNFIT